MRIARTALKIGACVGVLVLGIAPSAHAGVSVSVGGDSNWGITVTSSVSDNTPTYGTIMRGNTKSAYTAHFLGIPLPVTAYVMSSFPYLPFSRPVDVSDNAPLSSTTYGIKWDSYMGRNAWIVQGSGQFWGSNTWYINGQAKASYHKTSGYFHGGTGTGHSIDANTRDLVTVS